ncbi:MAG: Epimerase family protein [candidate division BRC1 bacterium ADurb.BinA364]|nr:MAG: Epimerase family protein [candidate division BRC1 bacterium ADurb.BinA364]
MKTAFIAGATGFIGRAAAERLRQAGWAVAALSRDAAKARAALGEDVEIVAGDPARPGDWTARLDGCDAVVNLAGESVAGRRWTAAARQAIRDSRVESAQCIAAAIGAARNPPRALICASGSGYYGSSNERSLGEEAPAGGDFLARVCVEWEAAARQAEAFGARVALLRFGVVLHRSGGALARMLPLFRLGLGGPLGHGRQGFPWIHRDDAAGMILWLLETEGASGAFNAVAPDQATNAEFAKALGRLLRRPAILPAPALALRLLFGEGASVVLSGQFPSPRRALEMGYRFRFPSLRGALAEETGWKPRPGAPDARARRRRGYAADPGDENQSE